MIPAHLLHPDCSLGSMGVAGCVWIQGFLEANPKIGLGSKAHLLGFAPGWEKVPQDPNVLPFWKTELRDKFLVHSSSMGVEPWEQDGAHLQCTEYGLGSSEPITLLYRQAPVTSYCCWRRQGLFCLLETGSLRP